MMGSLLTQHCKKKIALLKQRILAYFKMGTIILPSTCLLLSGSDVLAWLRLELTKGLACLVESKPVKLDIICTMMNPLSFSLILWYIPSTFGIYLR